MCFLFGEDDNGKCGRYWDNYIYIDYMGYIGEDDNGKCGRYWDNYIYIDYMGYMTNPIDLCWFMKLITHLAINWGCFFFFVRRNVYVNSKKMDVTC